MTRVQMTQDFRSASADGVNVTLYANESIHDVSAETAAAWLKKGVAVELGDDGNPVGGGALEAMSVPELRDLAKERGVAGLSNANKGDLVKALSADAGTVEVENQALGAAPEVKSDDDKAKK